MRVLGHTDLGEDSIYDSLDIQGDTAQVGTAGAVVVPSHAHFEFEPMGCVPLAHSTPTGPHVQWRTCGRESVKR